MGAIAMSGETNLPATHVVEMPVPRAKVQLEAVVAEQPPAVCPAAVAHSVVAKAKQHMSLP